jgi:ABC-2 type transport system permease protein
MAVLFHILKFKVVTFFTPEQRLKFSYILKNIGTSLVYILFAYGTYLFTTSTIKYLMEDVKIGMFLLHRFIFVVLFIFFMAVNIGNIVVSYSTLFRTKEVEFLITKPISFTKLFLVKFLDNFFYSSSTLLLVITAVVFGYAEYFNLPWYFLPFAILFMVLPFMFIAGSLGSIILLIILRLSAKFGVRQVITSIAIIYGTTILTFYYFSSPVHLVNKVFEYFPNINNYFGFLEHPFVKLLPNNWISEALFWISSGKILAAGWFIYLLVISSLLIFLLSLFLAKKWYYRTWLVSLDLAADFAIKKNNKKKIFAFENSTYFAPQEEAFLKREFILFFREPSQWTHLAVMLFLITIFVSSIGSIDAMILKAYNVYLKTLVYLVIYLFNVFLIASLSLRFVFQLSVWRVKQSGK